jgi:predicted alpha/beta superfamily hydrolase
MPRRLVVHRVTRHIRKRFTRPRLHPFFDDLMPRARFAFGFALLALLPSTARAQTPPAPVSWTTHTIKSTALGTERPYFVALPPGYAQGTARHPVLVLLDADDRPQFVAALANIQFLISRDEAPGLVIVGIPNGRDRTHDMTPATRAADEQKLFPTAGGEAAFRKFIRDEVLPAVRASYRTLPTTFLAGHSFGGLFALSTAASTPGAFAGYIAMSPAVHWSNSEYVVSLADQLLRHKQPTRMFVSSGGLEPPIDASTRRLIARLDSTAHPALALRYRRYPDDTHGLTPMPSVVDGLRFMFDKISLRAAQGVDLPRTADSASIVHLAVDLVEPYATGARELGMPEKLPEQVLNEWGYNALRYFESPGAAVAIFRRNVELYPGSANVYDSLSDALLARGDTAGARAQLEKAIELAKATGHPVLQESTRKLEALKKK